MKRREFLQRTSLLVGATAAPAFLHAASPTTTPAAAPTLPPSVGTVVSEFVPVRGHVGYFRAGGSTVAWLNSPQAIVVVDSYFPPAAAELIQRLTGGKRRVDVLINSHHHPDHVGGNSAFRPVTEKIVAHEAVPAVQLAQARDRNTVNYQVYADTLFQKKWRFDAGDEIVKVRYVGYPSHTTSDSIVHFEKANVVHLADLVFNRYYPMTDRPGGVVIRDWIKALDEVLKYYPSDALYIYGHARNGHPYSGGQEPVVRQRDYLSALLDYTEKSIKAGKSRDELIGEQEVPGFPDWKAPQPNFISRNFAAAWDELTHAPRPAYVPFVSQLYKT